METTRRKKGESIMQKLASEFINEYAKNFDQSFGIITVTGVKISSDLSYGDIFVSSLFNSGELTKFLAKGAKELESIIHKEMLMRKTPRIRFRYDDSGEKMFEVTQTINKTTKEIKS